MILNKGLNQLCLPTQLLYIAVEMIQTFDLCYIEIQQNPVFSSPVFSSLRHSRRFFKVPAVFLSFPCILVRFFRRFSPFFSSLRHSRRPFQSPRSKFGRFFRQMIFLLQKRVDKYRKGRIQSNFFKISRYSDLPVKVRRHGTCIPSFFPLLKGLKG